MASVLKALRWAVVWADLESGEGHEQSGTRPVLVVSNEWFHRSHLLTIVPITSASIMPRYPGDVPVQKGEAGLRKSGLIQCAQIRTISMKRANLDEVQHLRNSNTRALVRDELAFHLGLDVSPGMDGANGAAFFRETPVRS